MYGSVNTNENIPCELFVIDICLEKPRSGFQARLARNKWCWTEFRVEFCAVCLSSDAMPSLSPPSQLLPVGMQRICLAVW